MLKEYDLDVTPPESIDDHDSTIAEQVPESTTAPQTQPKVDPGSFRQLFSLLSARHRLLLLLPAVIFSIISGGIAPFMTIVIGQNFNTFAQFPQEPNPPQSAKNQLLHSVGIAALELLGLSVGSIALSAVTSSLWIWTGEMNVKEVRRRVFGSVISQEMVWFEAKTQGEAVGAAGLMAQFASDTDSIRLASSIASGLLLQHLVTAITALVLAFVGSPLLTLLTLASVPLLSLIQGISQRLAARRLSFEREDNGRLATLIERSFTLISTVKAFTAVPDTLDKLHSLLYGRMRKNEYALNVVWGLSSGTSQFVMMGMFVQAFWFGSKLVREGKMQAGSVMSVFWACLIATSNLQLCVPQLVIVGKGKVGMAALMKLVKENPEYDPDAIVSSPNSPYPSGPISPSSTTISFSKPRVPLARSKSHILRKIQPKSFKGDITLSGVTFSYPTRDPSSSKTKAKHVLDGVDIYIPASETTFIVGSSGSGKSSIAGIVAGFYKLSPGIGGSVLLDDQDTRFLDPAYLDTHIGIVNQGALVIMAGKSIHYNVAIALSSHPTRTINSVTRAEVVDVCRAVLLHEFIRDLPDGYDTVLVDDTGVAAGESDKEGIQLSGGQKQRLALARAKLRNPGVLILDEPTSALDPTSRSLISAAIRHWRKNKTTVIITHDLSRETIQDSDFVYVMKDGRVAEAGYRYDLEHKTAGGLEGEFSRLVRMQGLEGADETVSEGGDEDYSAPAFSITAEDEPEDLPSALEVTQPLSHRLTKGASVVGTWMFDVVAELTSRNIIAPAATSPRVSRTLSPSRLRDNVFPPVRPLSPVPPLPRRLKASTPRIDTENANRARGRARRPSSVSIPSPGFPLEALEKARSPFEDSKGVARQPRRRMSLQFEPATPRSGSFTRRQVDDSSFDEKEAMERSTQTVNDRRKRTRRAATTKEQETIDVVVAPSQQCPTTAATTEIPFRTVFRELYQYIPSKILLFVGLVVCVLSGAMTPIFSFLLSKLLFEVSTGAKDARTINIFGSIVLGVAAADGVLMGLKFALMESLGWGWIARIREAGMRVLLKQTKSFYEVGSCVDSTTASPSNDAHAPSRTSPVALTQVLTKSGDDAKNLLAVVAGQTLVVFTMLSVGLIWAFVVGWQFTLVGLAIAPIFAGVMSFQTRLVAQAEMRSRKSREGVAGVYYETISHIRSIRSAALTPLFQSRFDIAADHAFNMGVKGALVEGCTYGVASGLIYAAEALLFYVGAVLVAKGTYTYLQMVQVLDLVVFTVTIGSQLMAFTNRIARSVQATRELHAILRLPTDNSESNGILRPEINGPLSIEFQNVTFAYPSRPDVPVLKNFSLSVAAGETVALVGSSGCGKSTIAQLLQRLYEPSSGSVHVSTMDVSCLEVDHLRKHISVVSQQPNLFDVSVAENISYGNPHPKEVDVRKAAKAANIHGDIMSLPKGYETIIGENASMLSGGQAQRVQIARALARPCRILILDECTSALDPENQKAVLETIKGLNNSRGGAQRTTVMVTHKVPAMKMCDRVLVISDGKLVEEGKYDELMERRGVFAQLASGGEWLGE